MSKAPPQLHFDDGSRIMTESSSTTTHSSDPARTLLNPRGDTPIDTYYEIDRIANQIIQDIIPKVQVRVKENEISDGFLCKVALQFPDELLADAAQVSWLLEDAILTKYSNNADADDHDHDDDDNSMPLVFILGDTTYASCCPDEIGAQHLNADVIVHFGQYACLSVSDSLPVIYSFGVEEWPGVEYCATCIIDQVQVDAGAGADADAPGEWEHVKFILVCERRFHHSLGQLEGLLQQKGLAHVVVGTIPTSNGTKTNHRQVTMGGCCQVQGEAQKRESGCCNSDATAKEQCCEEQAPRSDCCETKNNCCAPPTSISTPTSNTNHEVTTSTEESDSESESDNGCFIGGLHIAIPPSLLSEYTLIFIGDDSGQAKSRQFLNTILKCTTPGSSTKACWSYNPSTQQLSTDPMSILGVSRYLNRRFYLTQKAQMANIIGILVGTLSQDRFRSVVASVRQKIEDSGRSSYTFVVGKINVAKLANFAEVECFVLIACGETSILSDEREYHLPVITPTELEIALGEKEWGGSASCNTDFGDFLQGFEDVADDEGEGESNGEGTGDDSNVNADMGVEDGDEDDDSSDDEPYFSMISGTYVSKPKSLKALKKSQESSNNSNLEALPGQGQVTEYKSEAAEFWKKREYKGLEAQIGKDEAKAAIKGQTGIASDYGK